MNRRRNLMRREPARVTSLSPAQQITDDLYQVFVPRLFLQTAEAAAFYGAQAQDNAMAQKEQEQGDMRVTLPASKLAELFAKGCKPWFLKPEESLRMYTSITDYLKQAENEFNANPNSNRFTETLMENLLMLENYAHWLYGVAKPYFKPDDDVALKGTLAGYRRFTPMGRKSREQLEYEAAQRTHNERDHVRVVDELIERQVSRRRSGWT